MSYRRVVALAECGAAALRRRGLTGAHVGVALSGSIAGVVAYWSVVLAENTVVLLPPSGPPAVVRDHLDRAHARHAVGVPATLDALQLGAGIESLGIDDEHPCSVARVGGDTVQARPRPRPDVAVLAPTSGTSGAPKLVMWTHANLVHNAQAHAASLGLRPDDRGLVALPLHLAYGHTAQLLSHTALGGALILGGRMFHPRRWLAAARTGHATVAALVPSMVEMLARDPGFEALADTPLRLLSVGGDRVDASRLRALAQAAPSCALAHSYGLTEASPRVATLVDAPARLPALGRPVPGVEWAILDEHGRPCPAQTVGELCVRGPSVTPGYFDDPSATEVLLRGGWLHTGDLAHRDRAGDLLLDGRADAVIVSHGARISPEAVEAALRDHPQIEAARVRVEGRDAVADIVSAATPPTLHEVHRFLAGRLERSHWPRRIHLRRELPRTASGKVRRWRG